MTIVLVGLIVYGTVYFFNGYDITKVLCIIDIVLMLSGAIGASVGSVLSWKNSSVTKNKKLITVIIAALAVTFSTILIINSIKEAKPKYDTSNSYEMSHSTYCLVYMKVSDVQVRHSGNYAYISGTITNNGTYQIKYVKVRAVCKDAYGSIVDTDWTYAVDSDWLNPGESKKFEMMVSDRSDSIKTANVTVVMD